MRICKKYSLLVICMAFVTNIFCQSSSCTLPVFSPAHLWTSVYPQQFIPSSLNTYSAANNLLPGILFLQHSLIGNHKISIYPNVFLNALPTKPYAVTLPAYQQGKFCDFEDYLNRKNTFLINFGVE